MRLGVHVVTFPWPGGAPAIRSGLLRVAQAGECVGVTGLSLWTTTSAPPAADPSATRCSRATPASPSGPR